MRQGIYSAFVLVLVFALVLVPGVYAQTKKDTKSGLDRIEGRIERINKDASTVSVRQTGKTVVWEIVYNKDTKFTYRNATASVDEAKEGRRVICLGKFGPNNKMAAARIDVREK